jgi:hypothetical protein
LDVALVVSAAHLAEVDNLRFLAPALAERGLSARLVAWDDPHVDWSAFRLCVIRATWDYHLRLHEFLAWAGAVAALRPLWNPLDVIQWNSRKTYLRDLARRGVAIISTVWLPRGAHADLATLLVERDWGSAVVKPTVSASAYATVLVSPASIADGQAHLNALLATHAVMVQPFLASVTSHGERSLVFIDGELSHTFRRSPALGLATDVEPRDILVPNDTDESGFAEEVLRLPGRRTLYARVDLVRDDQGALRLMELEMVEPSLGLALSPWAAQRFADAIARRLNDPSA